MPNDLAGKFWDLSNAIVAFSVVQILAFLYALQHQEFREGVANMYPLVLRAIVISCFFYGAGVIACYLAERRSLPSGIEEVHHLRRLTCIVRVAVILLYSSFALYILHYGHSHNWSQKPGSPLT